MRKIRERGITLIALVITIVVLLILAGITIGAITGDNGIINKTGQAKEDAEIANEKEIIDISTVEAMGENKRGNLEEDEFQSAIDKHTDGKVEVTDIGEEFEVYFTETNRYYMVDKDGNIGEAQEVIKDKYPGDITVGKDGEQLDGSSEHPYEINCIEDLVALANIVNREGKVYKNGELIDASTLNGLKSGVNIILTRNLDFKSSSSYSDSKRTDFGNINGNDNDGNELITEMTSGTGFRGIGEYEAGKLLKTFAGIFDGNNYSIRNLYKGALFGSIRSSEIKNITVYGVKGEENSSGIIERVEYGNGTKIINCTNYINVKTMGEAGGILKYTGEANTKIINCINYGDIEGGGYGIGGILGTFSVVQNGKLLISNSINYGDMNFTTGISYSGCAGILGTAANAKGATINLNNCVNMGEITGKAVFQGSVIGITSEESENAVIAYILDNETKEIGKGSYEGKIERKTIEDFKSQDFIDLLNDYKDESGNYPSEWKRWKLGEDGYPTFE